MKIRYYVDLFPGSNFGQYIPGATANPGLKSEGCRRFAFDVTIPDHLLYGVDFYAPEVSSAELIEQPADLGARGESE